MHTILENKRFLTPPLLLNAIFQHFTHILNTFKIKKKTIIKKYYSIDAKMYIKMTNEV